MGVGLTNPGTDLSSPDHQYVNMYVKYSGSLDNQTFIYQNSDFSLFWTASWSPNTNTPGFTAFGEWFYVSMAIGDFAGPGDWADIRQIWIPSTNNSGGDVEVLFDYITFTTTPEEGDIYGLLVPPAAPAAPASTNWTLVMTGALIVLGAGLFFRRKTLRN